jgi:hypothetical protein
MKTLPIIDYQQSKDTITLLHLTSQMLGKLMLRRKPWRNHSWHSTLLPSSRGFITQIMAEGDRRFQLELDMLGGKIRLYSAKGEESVDLTGATVADVHSRLGKLMEVTGLSFDITPTPCEIPDASLSPRTRAQSITTKKQLQSSTRFFQP